MALTKDMITLPQVWRLSMELHDDAVDVILTNEVEEQSMLHHRMPLDIAKSTDPLARQSNLTTAFEDFIYENPLLLSDFKRVDLLIDTPKFTIVPRGLDPDMHDDIVRSIWRSPTLQAVANDIPGTNDTLVMAVDSSLLAFARRTFLNTELTHPMTVLAGYCSKLSQQGERGQAYAHLRDGYVDLAAYRDGKLLVANTYQVSNADDAAYYILAALQNTGFSTSEDEIYVSGNAENREEIITGLRSIAQYVMPAIFPGELFKMSKDAMDAPYQLLLLRLCE